MAKVEMKTIDAHRLLFTPLSPIHIGTGESYEPTNYVIEEGTLYEFDTGAVVEALANSDRKELLAIASRRPDTGMIKAVQKYFHDKRATLLPWALHRIPVLEGVARLYADRVGQTANLEMDGKQVINRLEIDRTAHNPVNYQPVLFGFSIKGAMRTALLNGVNGRARLQVVQDRRTGKERKENNLEMQQRLFKYRAGKFELDPMRLVQLSDAAWQGEAGLSTTQVFLAVNRKKVPVRDEQGNLRESQAEKKQLYQILECIPALHYRAFGGQLNVQSVAGIHAPNKLPDANLRLDMRQIAQACNAFYRQVFQDEIHLLRERGYIDEDWARSVEAVLQDPRLAEGTAFLLRVGRHSGAESVTLNGVRNIKILLGKGEDGKQKTAFEQEPRTVWLAANERGQQSNLLPFGWLLVEIAVPTVSGPADHAPLKSACEARLAPARQWSRALAEKQRAMVQARAEAEARRREAEEKARLHAAAEAEEARLEAERLAHLAAMTPELRAVEAFRDCYLAQKQRGRYQPGSQFDEKRLVFFKEVLSWQDSAARQAAATLLRETINWTGWPGKKERKAEFRDWLEQLGA